MTSDDERIARCADGNVTVPHGCVRRFLSRAAAAALSRSQPPFSREPRRRHRRGRETRRADNDRGGGHCIAVSTSNSVYTSAFSRRFLSYGTARLVSSRLVDGGISPRSVLFRHPRAARASPVDRPSKGFITPSATNTCTVRRRSVVAASFPPLQRPVVVPRRFRGGTSAKFSNVPRREISGGEIASLPFLQSDVCECEQCRTSVTGVLLTFAPISRDRLTFRVLEFR